MHSELLRRSRYKENPASHGTLCTAIHMAASHGFHDQILSRSLRSICEEDKSNLPLSLLNHHLHRGTISIHDQSIYDMSNPTIICHYAMTARSTNDVHLYRASSCRQDDICSSPSHDWRHVGICTLIGCMSRQRCQPRVVFASRLRQQWLFGFQPRKVSVRLDSRTTHIANVQDEHAFALYTPTFLTRPIYRMTTLRRSCSDQQIHSGFRPRPCCPGVRVAKHWT